MSVLPRRRGRIAVAAALLALMAPTAAPRDHQRTTRPRRYTNVGSFVVEVTPADGDAVPPPAVHRHPRLAAGGAHRQPLHGDRATTHPTGARSASPSSSVISDGDELEAPRRPRACSTGSPAPHPALHREGALPLRRRRVRPRRTGERRAVRRAGRRRLPRPEVAARIVVHHRGLRHRALRQDEGRPRPSCRRRSGCWRPCSRWSTVTPRLRLLLDEPRPRPSAAPATATPAARTSTPPGEVVAVTTTGDIPCKASDQADTRGHADAHDFIDWTHQPCRTRTSTRRAGGV